jgi:hypothetical protein
MFVTVVICEMYTVSLGEAQLSHWVVGQTPAMQGLEELRSPSKNRQLLPLAKEKSPHLQRERGQ